MSKGSARRQITRIVPARAGIVGNPSDGYGGRVVATTIGQLCARVTASPAEQAEEAVGDDDALLDAARTVAEGWLRAEAGVEVTATASGFTTDIPRQVGLAGSSAIVIGAIEALAELHGAEPDPTTVARLALRAEAELLGIAAGPQDRVVQAHRGLLDMNFGGTGFGSTGFGSTGLGSTDLGSTDFVEAWDPARYRRLPEHALGDVVVAWHPDPGAPSGVVHGDLRSRWNDGDPAVHEVMASLAELAGRAADVLRGGRVDALAAIIDEACLLRRRLWKFAAVDEALLAVADRAGAAATLAGSGGAIVAVARSGPDGAAPLCAAFEGAGLRALVPRPQPCAATSTEATPLRTGS